MSNDWCLVRKEDKKRHGEGQVISEVERRSYKSRILGLPGASRRQEEARKDSSLQPSRKGGSADTFISDSDSSTKRK
jgi:hypothetical protein